MIRFGFGFGFSFGFGFGMNEMVALYAFCSNLLES